MKTLAVCVLLTAASALLQAQAPPQISTPEACQKNISFAVAEGGQPVPDVPKFASKWISKNLKDHAYPNLCFSQIPSSTLNNYVIVLSSSEQMFEGLVPSAHTYTSSTPASGNNALISSYGGTWSYAYIGVTSPTTTTTLDLGRDDKPRSLYARAYNQEGHVISRYSPGGWLSRDRLMESIVAAISSDTLQPARQRPVAAPLSVYYVNCDVDQPTTHPAIASLAPAEGAPASDPAAAQPRTPPPPPPPPLPTLELWSNPQGADIYLDGNYVGRTPFSATVHPGEHTVILRKQDFGSYERKLQVGTGKRSVGAYLEQRTLTLQ